jgi:glutathione synthase/RimK-type ligase-like ATP-grasp enzyme
MVNAMINISEKTNHILNIVKAKHNLKDKSAAIDFIVMEYGDSLLEPNLKPEFIEKLKKIKKEPTLKFKSVDELREHIRNA